MVPDPRSLWSPSSATVKRNHNNENGAQIVLQLPPVVLKGLCCPWQAFSIFVALTILWPHFKLTETSVIRMCMKDTYLWLVNNCCLRANRCRAAQEQGLVQRGQKHQADFEKTTWHLAWEQQHETGVRWLFSLLDQKLDWCIFWVCFCALTETQRKDQ